MTTMLLTYTNNILALVFLSVSSLPNIGSENWVGGRRVVGVGVGRGGC